MIGDSIEVGGFRQESADEAIGIFDGGFLPPAAGSAEVRLEVESSIQAEMESVFDAVVVGDGFAQSLWSGSEDSGKGVVGGQRRFILDFGQAREAGFAFDGDLESGASFAHDQIDFPVAGFLSEVGGLGPEVDGSAAWDSGAGTIEFAQTSVRMAA